MEPTRKLVTRYDAQRNEYTVFRHNLSEREAADALQQLAGQLYALFIVDQHGIHAAEDPQDCPACRRDVEHSSQLQPKPKFRRRDQ